MNWATQRGQVASPSLSCQLLVPSLSYGAGVPNSRGHQRPVSAMKACFGGIRHAWVKVVRLLWEVVLLRKQGELRLLLCV